MSKDGKLVLICASDDDRVEVREAKTLKLKYYLPSGDSISDVGVVPDFEVAEESDSFRINTETDNQLDFALKLLNG